MVIKRTASAQWSGGLRDGEGRLQTESGALSNTPYSFSTRFENETGSNPEELVGAAHAGCFTMAVTVELEKMGFKPAKLHTDAIVSLEKKDARWTVSRVELKTVGNVTGLSEEQFQKAVAYAKENCPISRLLKAEISAEAKLLSEEKGFRKVG